ncbi:hypothetical protein NDU88_005579 [Pleurodeles waltl]|uniref:Uncharacterized protein n=1 Tax=Pleurodeles waltl TaxID=8319 RepID=A0AAV7UMI6_PLEWA|nr:hypothetical protein NDU88_005579 [Pleurodeles waltl]
MGLRYTGAQLAQTARDGGSTWGDAGTVTETAAGSPFINNCATVHILKGKSEKSGRLTSTLCFNPKT